MTYTNVIIVVITIIIIIKVISKELDLISRAFGIIKLAIIPDIASYKTIAKSILVLSKM